MIRADYKDKKRIVDILTSSFDDNKSVNYIVKQDRNRAQRMRKLMEYSFDVCYLFGDIFLSEDKKGCALIVMPDKKKTTLKSILLDSNLALSVIGLSNIKKAMNRESKINKLHPKEPFYYLWFIGVDPLEQNKGIGTKLMEDVINEAISKRRPVYLETSTLKNIPWYEKFGFTIYHELDFGYKLFFLKRG
jgi:Acetyltransferase (GNAT) family